MLSTKHIALAVNEELDLHTRLIVCNSMTGIGFLYYAKLLSTSFKKSSAG